MFPLVELGTESTVSERPTEPPMPAAVVTTAKNVDVTGGALSAVVNVRLYVWLLPAPTVTEAGSATPHDAGTPNVEGTKVWDVEVGLLTVTEYTADPPAFSTAWVIGVIVRI